MFDPSTGKPHTAHTLYDVECIVVDPDRTGDATGTPTAPSGALRSGGKLADVMPTLIAMMGLEAPPEMEGVSLLQA
jgi:2,3-bisphosphoglycerate-independent phosphoglycerate mutase